MTTFSVKHNAVLDGSVFKPLHLEQRFKWLHFRSFQMETKGHNGDIPLCFYTKPSWGVRTRMFGLLCAYLVLILVSCFLVLFPGLCLLQLMCATERGFRPKGCQVIRLSPVLLCLSALETNVQLQTEVEDEKHQET